MRIAGLLVLVVLAQSGRKSTRGKKAARAKAATTTRWCEVPGCPECREDPSAGEMCPNPEHRGKRFTRTAP